MFNNFDYNRLLKKPHSCYNVFFRLEHKIKLECQLCFSNLQIGKLSLTFIPVSSKSGITFFFEIFSMQIKYRLPHSPNLGLLWMGRLNNGNIRRRILRGDFRLLEGFFRKRKTGKASGNRKKGNCQLKNTSI